MTQQHTETKQRATKTATSARTGNGRQREEAPARDSEHSAFGGLETREPLTEEQIEGIARELLAQLTLDEKLWMMCGDMQFFEGMWVLRRGGYYRQPRTTAGAIPRRGIPGVRFADGPRGYHGEGATTFPQGSTRGASWGPSRSGSAMPWGARRGRTEPT